MLYLDAVKGGDHLIAGLCRHNMAREYQLLGGLRTALEFENEALELLQAEVGSLNYLQALANRCHILIDLGRLQEAYLDFEKVRLSPFPEMVEASKVIEKILGENQASVAEDFLTPTWRERLGQQNREKLALGTLEEKLLHLLARRPHHKFEIIEQLYGTDLPLEHTENRFKNLLLRLKKKISADTIVFEKGRYSLNERVILPEIGKAN